MMRAVQAWCGKSRGVYGLCWKYGTYIGSAKSLSGFSNQKRGGVLVDFFAVLLITNYFVFFGSIGLTQPYFGSILAE
jgi:hypothetical protein